MDGLPSPARPAARRRAGARPAWAGLVLAGVAARYLVTLRGHNPDFDAYRIVAGLARSSLNIYDLDPPYHYGPPWLLLLTGFDRLARRLPDEVLAFRLLLVTFLTLVDLGIAAILWRRWGRGAALLFFLNPVSVLITGYHNQFDNAAVLVALGAMAIHGEGVARVGPREAGALALLGLSLSVKHVYFAFPFWLACKYRRWGDRAAAALLPPAVFALTFAPFWPGHGSGIWRSVVRYEPFLNAPFHYLFVPRAVGNWLGPRTAWFVALAVAGFALRRRGWLEGALLYTLVQVAFSPAVYNQYLAIVGPAVAVWFNWLFALFWVATAVFLVGDVDGLHVAAVREHFPRGHDPRDVLVVLLLAGTAWALWSGALVRAARRAAAELGAWVRGRP